MELHQVRYWFYPASKNVQKLVAEERTRSSLSGVSLLISKDFLRLLLIVNLTAVPLVWYLMSQWLSSFAFQINTNFWMFAVAWPPLNYQFTTPVVAFISPNITV